VADAQHDDDFQEGDGGGFRHHVGRTADAEEATSAASECSVLFGIFVVKQSISVGVVLQAKFSTGERSMDLKTFLSVTRNVHEARHGKEFIYIGNDVVPCRWLAFFNGKERELEFVNSLEEAKVAAHHLFDNGKCSVELKWKLIPETATKTVELPAPSGWE
jgi:hypothetical protein